MTLHQTAHPNPVIIDTDPGVDDAIALLMALACPQLDVIGITTTAGNVPLARATRNTLAILQHLARTAIPVFRGAARPVRGRYAYARHVHSASGLTRRLPEPSITPSSVNAVPFLANTLTARPGAITLIALGPLTNLARLLRRHPAAIRAARNIIVMGGAVAAPGNATPHAEFNFHSDPTAARQVMESGIPLTLVDLAACRQVHVSPADIAQVTTRSIAGKLAAELLSNWFAQDASRARFNLYDPLALAAAIEPAVLQTRQTTIAVDDADTTDDASRWGKCQVTADGCGPIAVAGPDGVDSIRVHELMSTLLDWNRP